MVYIYKICNCAKRIICTDHQNLHNSSFVIAPMTRGRSLLIQFAIFTSVVFAIKGYQSFQGRLITRSAPRLRSEKDEERSVEVTTDPKASTWRTIGSVEDSTEDCELEIINDSHEPVILCWIDRDLLLHHHYVVNDKSIKDGSVSNRHTEYTKTGHAFVCFRRVEGMTQPEALRDVSADSFLFHCQLPRGQKTKLVVDVQSKSVTSLFRRKRKLTSVVTWRCEDLVEVELLDTASKRYDDVFMHGFCLKCEGDVLIAVPELQKCLDDDLQAINSLLPSKARALLQQSTPLFLNKSLTYGPKASPIVFDSMCYHPIGGKDWLRKHGLSEAKEGSIEIGSADDYVRSRGLWGTGGLLLHELCHAYHNKFCDNGYECDEIQEAYEKAIGARLYDCVPVHGAQGTKGPMKAYACTNCMEFFAELSVAFLYDKDEVTEFNKWFPFNKHQLKIHDPHTFQVLQAVWSQHE